MSKFRPSNNMEQGNNTVAQEMGIQLNDGYNGDITAQEAGNMVKKMVEYSKKHMK